MHESSDSHMEAVARYVKAPATLIGDIGDLLPERHALEKSNNRLEFTFSATNETFRIKPLMNCTSTNLIYLITCTGCGAT